ncbi:HNHc domain-containing protein [Fusarium keratoplasticum]|uniref:HNHc domain-containing protein n=1 Tax=Fusarium keratoplasticum TaxID=1328300 RepID=A0ACC0R9F4_9HYPO|nr:HNHc domain-containing protein [Fusarium keratoplasticum]KAI8680042.1 HNHc domain-containing protein [Fusarium keratoplasticum]
MADPAYQEPSDLVPLEDVTIRTEYALKIQKRIQRMPWGKDFRLNNVHLAMFAIAPLSIFRNGMLSDGVTASVVHQLLEALPPLIKHFLGRWPDKAYDNTKALDKIREQFQQLGLEGPEEDDIADMTFVLDEEKRRNSSAVSA